MDNNSFSAQSWSDIYDRLLDIIFDEKPLHPILGIVDYLSNSDMADKLFACVVGHTLVISKHDPVIALKDTLHLNYEHHNETIRFQYYFRNRPLPKFEKEYPADLGVTKIKNFIDQARW